MQRRRDKRAGGADRLKPFKIVRVANAACGKDAPISRTLDDLRDPREVGTRADADARERHDDDLTRPQLGAFVERIGTQKNVVAKIERENDIGIMLGGMQGVAVAQGFAADHTIDARCAAPVAGRGAGVDHEAKRWKSLRQCADLAAVVAASLDRVEIGDIDLLEWMKRQKTGDDIGRRACRRKRRRDWLVAVAVAGAGAHDRAVANIDDGDDLHGAL